MEDILNAMVGTSVAGQNTAGSDFGYVGDVGAFPNSLNDLNNNPGYSNWSGPYIAKFNEDADGFQIDEWGKTYSYNGSTTITSSGSGGSISKSLPGSANDYLLNSYAGVIRDLNDSLPGIIYNDSIDIEIFYPNGSGTSTVKSYHPEADGSFHLDSLPIGQHLLMIIYKPDFDTLKTFATIYPRNNDYRIFKLTSAYFSSSGGSGGSGVETLYPEGSGSSTQLLDENCSSNWSCVDETSPDGDGTYVKGEGNNWKYDLYTCMDHSAGSGTIDSVKINIYGKGGGNKKIRTYIRTNNQNFESGLITPGGSYANYSTLYINNPATGSAWSWSEIDNIEIGCGIRQDGFITQVYLEVYYTE